MATKTIDLLPYGIEQGTLDWRGQPSPNSTRVRSVNYIQLPSEFVNRKITVTATSGSDIYLALLGYPDTTSDSNCDIEWYKSPYTFDLSSYPNTAYIKMTFRYSGSGNIYPNDIRSAVLSYNDGIDFEIGENGYPVPIAAPDIIEPAMAAPYPAQLWRIQPCYNNEYPFNALLPEIPHSGGAFAGASDLAAVRIPISVKAIGTEAFKDTALQRVRIAADCTYSEQSFPEGCVVTRYPDDRYEQLYDSAGKAVLDYDARRVYVLKEDNNNG